MRTPRDLLRNSWSLLLFLVIPGLGAVTPLLVYPSITSQFGADGFAAVAIGLSVGMTVSAICELGWGVLGPQRIARERPELHLPLVRSSLATKTLALVLGAPIAVLVAWYTVEIHHLAAALTALGASLTALNPAWYLIGLNRPLWILYSDTLPKILLNLAVAGSLLAGAPLLVYGASTILSSVIPLALLSLLSRASLVPRGQEVREGFRVIAQQGPLTIGRAVSVAYTSLPVTITGVLMPGAAALFAGTDRIMRMGLTVLAGVPSRLQSYIGVEDKVLRDQRVTRVLAINLGLGVIAAGVFIAALGPAMSIFYTGTIDAQLPLTLVMGAVVLAVCVSRGYGLCLVARGLANRTVFVTGSAALTGCSLLFLLVPQHGAVGAAIAVLSAEVVGIVVQMLFVHRAGAHR
ncbi:lipopolysaccharide biosynthesis protein [Brachybacterium massiliense]|uniref:lipopolysaccharide biosynthesis protein n=1 Tax=Brachybacterium massiliense TaxID=1755098 RepID=UPI000B3BD323|nr:hypothetical protein [Brachybacterium massiliense]